MALAEAVVDLQAIGHNVEVLAKHSRAPVMAVVKADGFGHGAVQVARACLAHGATWLGVTTIAEALELRAAGLTAPTLSWMHLPDEDFVPAIEADVELAVSSLQHLEGIAACAGRSGRPAGVHLKVDTGLARNGSLVDDWPGLLARTRRLADQGLVEVRGLWSHVDGERPSVAGQISRFEEALEIARAAGIDPPLRHMANSAAILTAPESHYDLVRAGIALYGFEPVSGRRFGLRPALTLRARVIMVKRVPAGSGVSYQHVYTTARETTLALVALGYADGVPRVTTGRASVWVAGELRPVAGMVAMDQFVTDVGDLPVRIGDEVVLMGPGDQGEPTAADWAGWAETNPHEILTGIGRRVPRRYVPDETSQTVNEEPAHV